MLNLLIFALVLIYAENSSQKTQSCTYTDFIRDNKCANKTCAVIPPPPTAQANFTKFPPDKQLYLFGGEEVNVSCQGYVTPWGFFDFSLEGPEVRDSMYGNRRGYNVFYRGDMDVIRFEKDRELRVVNGRCQMFSRAYMKMTITKDMNMAFFGCCYYTNASYVRCGATEKFKVRYKGKKPDVYLLLGRGALFRQVVGDKLIVRCIALVGTFGRLTLKRECSVYNFEIVLYSKDKPQTRRYEDGSVLKLWPVKIDLNNGPEMTVDITMWITYEMKNSRFTCQAEPQRRAFQRTEKAVVATCPKRPEIPKVDIQFHASPNKLYGGKDVNVTCSVLVGNTSLVELWEHPAPINLVKQTPRMLFKKTIGYSKVKIMPRFPHDMKYEGGCFQEKKTTNRITASSRLQEAKLACCVTDSTKIKMCGFSEKINVTYAAHRPRMEYDSLLDNKMVSATCFVYVGSGNTGLAWKVARGRKESVWVVDKVGQTTKVKDELGFKGLVISPLSPSPSAMYGPSIRSNLTLYDKEGMHNTAFGCYTYDFNKKKMDGEQKIGGNPESPPQVPVLQVKYLEKPGQIPYGKILQVNCSTYLGSSKHLSWVLNSPRATRRWTLGLMGPFTKRDPALKVNISSRAGEMSEWSGPRFESWMKIYVNYTLDKGTIECHPYALSSSDPRWRYTATPKLEVIYVPWPPKLKVNYHSGTNEVITDLNLKATCTTYVGTNGSLTWAVITDSYVRVWPVYGPGVVEEGISEGEVQIKTEPAIKKELGPHMTSRLSLSVTADLEGGVLACYSHDVSEHTVLRPEGDELANTSLPLVVIVTYSSNPSLSKATASQESYQLLYILQVVGLLLVLAAVGTAVLYDSKKSSNTAVVTSSPPPEKKGTPESVSAKESSTEVSEMNQTVASVVSRTTATSFSSLASVD